VAIRVSTVAVLRTAFALRKAYNTSLVRTC
jgi:hypothetical protein